MRVQLSPLVWPEECVKMLARRPPEHAAIFPMCQAVVDGRCRVILHRRNTWVIPQLLVGLEPTLTIVGDDDVCPTGPDGWPQRHSLMEWAHGVTVHAAGAKPEHYELAVLGAEMLKRHLFIETTSPHLEAWAALIPLTTVAMGYRPKGESMEPIKRR